ncbi:GNAT family N-acetyltransferase [Mangrovicoccus algicola]|uniref:GNAT family N-acetyltransferase n=1 Tax=Mangrovicoccus algicola TaxID=2771008 RepID=A0A8J7CV64_9RHOB|nr:GNAT family N-acetyltransferase [Mangrovicoccus algicola]MBE3638384.1 GNAT family N-acetyltransferase [Mangrovicoccus algicola]
MRFRTAATPAEIALVLDWARAEGWNPGLEDAAAFHAADPGGIFLAEQDGAPVAAISVINHSDTFAFLGLYLCLPAFRGRGIGHALWTHALAHAGERTVGLDGVAAQEANYARSGFVRQGATLRMAGPAPIGEAPGLRPAGGTDLAAIAALDLAATGVARPRFLAAWLMQARSRRSIVLDRDGRVAGVATARLCGEGCKIGPVIAPDADAAWTLIAGAAAALSAQRVILDVPEWQDALTGRLAAAGFATTFATARMYRGPAPAPAAGGTQHAIATMELG